MQISGVLQLARISPEWGSRRTMIASGSGFVVQSWLVGGIREGPRPKHRRKLLAVGSQNDRPSEYATRRTALIVIHRRKLLGNFLFCQPSIHIVSFHATFTSKP